jgi:HEAT repeat protein
MHNYSRWTVSAKAISFLGPDAIAPMLHAATNLAGKHELWELLHNFENLGTNGAAAVPALAHRANDPDEWVRLGVMNALGGIGKRPDLAVPVLLKAVRSDENSMVRRDAATALGAFAADSEEVLPELKKTLKDADWEARGGALSGLGKIQSKPEVVVPLIVPFLYDTNNVLQRSAAYALRDLGSEAGFKALMQATNAPSSWPGIQDIIFEVKEKCGRKMEK